MARSTGRTSRRALGCAGLLAVLAATGCREPVPPTITVDDVVAELLPEAAAAASAARPDASVALDAITPGDWMRGDGPRPAVVMSVPARLDFVATAPANTFLRFGVGVGGVKDRVSDVSGIRFRLEIDGVERFVETLAPAARRRDRRWSDAEIPLGGNESRPVRITFWTDLDDPDLPPLGTPGWSRLQVVRRTAYPRAPAAAGLNVLVLLVDTLRADRVGGRPSLTPNLDALGARGLVFERAIAQSSWTLQSVPSIFTGLIPRSHGVRGNFWGDPSDDHAAGEHLADALETLAEAAARRGVTTVGVSANPLVSRATNLAQGFETFEEFRWDPKAKRFADADEVNARFLDWLRDHRGLRFFGWLHYMDVHDPYTPPDDARPTPPPGLPKALARGWVLGTARRINFKGAPKLPPAYVDYLRQLYDAEVRAWDATLPALLDGLRAEGVLDSTIVVVTSDHGEEFQEHGFLKHGQTLHAELVDVPLVVAGPGIPTGHPMAQVQGVDLYPTLARIMGAPVPAAVAGRDLLAANVADADVVSETSHAVGDGGTTVDGLSLRTPAWTLLAYPASGRHLLFHRPDDPGEHADRFPTDPEGGRLVKALRARLDAAPAPPRVAPAGGDLRERLRQLGYAD